MAETVNEHVSVDLVSSHTKGAAFPYVLSWRRRRYLIQKIGLHHTFREGRVLFHLFSVSDGTTYFKLQFDTETLRWKLLEVEIV